MMKTSRFSDMVRIKIDGGIYRLDTFGESSNVVVWLDGVAEYGRTPEADGVFDRIQSCCVFSHVLDLMAYIMLQRRRNRHVCHNLREQCYMVVKPGWNYSLVYEHLKRYKEVHGYIRVNDDSEAINQHLNALLESKYHDETKRFKEYGSLVTCCMQKYKLLEV